MNPPTLQREDKAFTPTLYIALELSNRSWKLVFGDGTKRCRMNIEAGELMGLREALVAVRERFALPPSARVVSCYEAGRA